MPLPTGALAKGPNGTQPIELAGGPPRALSLPPLAAWDCDTSNAHVRMQLHAASGVSTLQAAAAAAAPCPTSHAAHGHGRPPMLAARMPVQQQQLLQELRPLPLPITITEDSAPQPAAPPAPFEHHAAYGGWSFGAGVNQLASTAGVMMACRAPRRHPPRHSHPAPSGWAPARPLGCGPSQWLRSKARSTQKECRSQH